MSTSRDSCCLPSVKKQKHDFQVFAFVQCIIKQLLDSVFVISRIIKVSVRVISLSLRLRLITLTSTLIILDITKTSSNNCLLSFHAANSCKRQAQVTNTFSIFRGGRLRELGLYIDHNRLNYLETQRTVTK